MVFPIFSARHASFPMDFPNLQTHLRGLEHFLRNFAAPVLAEAELRWPYKIGYGNWCIVKYSGVNMV